MGKETTLQPSTKLSACEPVDQLWFQRKRLQRMCMKVHKKLSKLWATLTVKAKQEQIWHLCAKPCDHCCTRKTHHTWSIIVASYVHKCIFITIDYDYIEIRFIWPPRSDKHKLSYFGAKFEYVVINTWTFMINPFPVIKEKISLILYFNKVGNRVEWLRLPNALNTTDCVKIDKKLCLPTMS